MGSPLDETQERVKALYLQLIAEKAKGMHVTSTEPPVQNRDLLKRTTRKELWREQIDMIQALHPEVDPLRIHGYIVQKKTVHWVLAKLKKENDLVDKCIGQCPSMDASLIRNLVEEGESMSRILQVLQKSNHVFKIEDSSEYVEVIIDAPDETPVEGSIRNSVLLNEEQKIALLQVI